MSGKSPVGGRGGTKRELGEGVHGPWDQLHERNAGSGESDVSSVTM